VVESLRVFGHVGFFLPEDKAELELNASCDGIKP
jgi:hypothetical protein